MAQKSHTDKAKPARPLLGRKFVPMSGAVKRRAFPQRIGESELVEGPASNSMARQQPTSRSGAASRRQLTTPSESKSIFTQLRLNRENACVGTLKDGYPLSYIDLFYLTHDKFGSFDLKDQPLAEMRDRLIHAERLVREGETSDGIQIYHELGVFFENQKRFDAAIYFYHRCREVAAKNDLHKEEATAYKGLGSAHLAIQSVPTAIEMYEHGSRIADTFNLTDILIHINRSLVQVYKVEAERLEEDELIEAALEYHHRGLEAAGKAQDLIAQGESSYRIGLIHFQKNEFPKALEFFQSYLKYSKDARYTDGIANALAKLALTYQSMGNISEAIQHLESLNSEASENGNTHAEAEATLHLGLLHQKQNNARKAVEFLEKHFNLARKIQDRHLIDAARVNLGIAQANVNIDSFNDVIRDNLPALLLWKNKRTKFQ